jgi:hypothetical protein
MGRWIVDGADAQTGRDLTMTVAADSEAEAASKARGRGLLASKVRPSVAQGESREPELPYESITATGSVVHGLGGFVIAFGILCFIGALALILQAMTASAGAAFGEQYARIVQVVLLGLAGLFFLAFGYFLRLSAAVGVAVRDIARKIGRGNHAA